MRSLFGFRNFGFFATLLLLCCSIAAFAQQGSLGSVAGTVHDASGAVISGAKVTLKNAGTNDTRSTTTTQEGGFVFNQVDTGAYAVTIEKDGFASETYLDVAVAPGQQYSLNASLKIGKAADVVEVTAGQDLIHTTTSEVSSTVDQQQILNLPLNGRNPIELVRNQAGVAGILAATRNNTGINGGRPGWTQMTQDGINIQDNFIRNNDLDFVPNRPTSDNIAEFSITTNNVGADSVGGTSQVRLVTPSGTNKYHGNLYEYNRNNALSANTFFNKHANPVVPEPDLNLNQYGGKIGGPILKDKLFFFGYYEAYRLNDQTTQALAVPTNNGLLTGNYTYVPSAGGAPVTVNVLNLINAHSGLPFPLKIDPTIQSNYLGHILGASAANGFNCGDSSPNRILNTECYNFNQNHMTNRDTAAARADYKINDRHSLQMTVTRFTDFDLRGDIDSVNPTPTAFIPTKARLFVGAWRWTITPSLLNEFRAGDNSVIAPFETQQGVPASLLTVSGLPTYSPVITFLPQGRTVSTRQYSDNANWTKGNHNVSFGISYQGVQPHPYNFAGVPPNATLGLSSTSPFFVSATNPNGNSPYLLGNKDLPTAATAAALSAMNSLAGTLAGILTSETQTFQVNSLNSGYAAGAPNKRAFDYHILSPYVQDSWRLRSDLTITAGLKWEYWSPVEESNSLALLPDINGNDLKGSLLNPNGTVSPHQHFWNPDYNQFAPNVGFAWTPFRDAKTVIRGGYSMAFVNEDEVTAASNAINGNFGLVGTVTNQNLFSQLQSGVPVIPTPTLSTNRTYAQQLASSGLTASVFGIQPDLQTPYVHELNFSIERLLPWNSAFEARYVGTLGRQLFKGLDYNQQLSGTNPAFLADFQRAQSNLFNCGAVLPTATCGQTLTILPKIDSKLTNSTILGLIRQGQVGELANTYYTNGFPNTAQFLPNPNIYVADAITNGGHLDYHALQLEARHRQSSGLLAQINYTFSKSLANSQGNSQNRLEPYLDNANPSYDYGRSEFDFTHIVNANFVYELPFGQGKHWLGNVNKFVDHFIGGWSTGDIIRWQSGSPFSILSARGSLNRSGRSGGETAFTTLTRDQMQGLLGVHDVNGTLYWIDPSVINPATGQAIGTVSGVGAGNGGFDPLSYNPTFTGQAFYNPLAGQVGNMQRLQFDGPANFDWDASLAKKTAITERFSTELRFDAFNVLNHQTFYFGDTSINSSKFGQITSTGTGRRLIQMSIRLDF